MGISYQICKCKYCGERILWFKTKKGKYIPCNPGRVCYKIPKDGEGTETIVTVDGDVISADKVQSDVADNVGYMAHFATCSKKQKEMAAVKTDKEIDANIDSHAEDVM